MIFVIQDNGQGMSPDQTVNAFNPEIQQGEPSPHGDESSGLGLGIVKRLVEDLKGEFWLDSREGKGTIVRLAFPHSATAHINENVREKQLKQAIDSDRWTFPFARKSNQKTRKI